MKKSLVVLLPLLVCGLSWHLEAQSLDNSGDSMLSGTYYFRQVLYSSDTSGNFVDAASVYGTLAFDGKGNYSMTGSVCEFNNNGCQAGGAAPSPLSTSGTYVIGANGFGYITSPYVKGDLVYGLVSKGIFIGGTTETTQLYLDMFIAAPVGSTPATNSTFQGTYSIVYTDPGYASGVPVDALFQANPNGQGSLGTINTSGFYEPGGTTSTGAVAFSTVTQTFTGVNYAFSNGAASVSLGGNGSFISPNLLLYISPDGNFVFGGAYNGTDFFLGVRTSSGTPNFSGLYYQAGLDTDLAFFDSYYGSLNAYSDGTILEHERLSLYGGGVFDYTFYDTYPAPLTSTGTYDDANFLSQHFIFGEGGAVRIGYGASYSGQSPILGITVALQAPSFSGSGVYLNPTGVLNDGSFAPFTAHLSPGELIALFGTGLSSGTASASTLPLQNTLGGVQVMINGRAAPLIYVSSTQINAVVPYFTENVAQIQVISNGKSSNTVTELMEQTSPGIITYSPADGTGYAAALHQNFTVVSPTSPAQPGETIQVYLTGLGAVTPALADGSPGISTSPYNTTTNTIMADISGTTATVGFSGVAPGFAGVYQLNIQIPTGLTAGANSLDIEGPDSYTSEALISIGSGTAAATTGQTPQVETPDKSSRRSKRPSSRQRHIDPQSRMHSASRSSS